MAAATLYSASQYSAFVKSRFPQRTIESLVTFGKPFLSALPKKDDLVGDVTYIPVETDHPQGLGSALGGSAGIVSSSSVNHITSSRGIRWAITRAKGYAMLTVDGETMMAMRNDEGSFFRAREREVKNVLEQLGQQLEMFLWQNGYGSLGTQSGDPSGAKVITLAQPSDAINFHEGMYVDFYANSSGVPSGSARAGGPYQIESVNYDTGVLTTLSTGSNIHADVVTGDHLVRFANSSYVSAGGGIKGVPAWIPTSAPTDTFFGQGRTLYPQKLGGHRQTWLGSIEETVKALDSKIRRVNQKPKTLWLSYTNFNRLETELGARGYRMEDGGEGKFSRPTLVMASPGGPVMIKAGPYVPESGAWLLDMDTWALHTLGALPHIIDDDGNTALRVQSLSGGSIEDSIEMRFRWMCQLVCTNPFANGYLAIS